MNGNVGGLWGAVPQSEEKFFKFWFELLSFNVFLIFKTENFI